MFVKMDPLVKLTQLPGKISLLGAIQAGIPVSESARPDRLDTFDVENLRIPKSMRTFALKVRGDSMINAGIHTGDVVILDFEKEPKNRDIVAALIDGDSTLIHSLTPTFISSKGYPTTHLDMDAVEAVGLIKMDILAQGGLAVMRDTVNALSRRGSAVDLEALEPWEDPEVWEMIAGGGASVWFAAASSSNSDCIIKSREKS